ncbi:hypothetical protein ACLMJK_008475 [Lecanora helva]
MHFIRMPSLLLVHLAATICAETITQFEAAIDALSTKVIALDSTIAALTPQTPATTVQQIPPSLQSISAGITSAVNNAQGIPTTSDAATEVIFFEAFGLLTNEIWNIVDELAFQKSNLINVFGLRTPIHTQIINLNTTYQQLNEFTYNSVGDAASKKETLNYDGDSTGGTIRSINLAAAAFA